MKALTIWQPWASLIVEGSKDIENRSWSTDYRGPLLIHAGAHKPTKREREMFDLGPLQLGGIVGVAQLVDCVRDHPSSWAMPDCWHWVLEAPQVLPFVVMRGAQGLWECTDYPYPVR
jgi:hypothetical protein